MTDLDQVWGATLPLYLIKDFSYRRKLVSIVIWGHNVNHQYLDGMINRLLTHGVPPMFCFTVQINVKF